MEIQRIAPPHPAFSEVGPRLLIKEFAPEKAVDLELFIADGKNLSGLELQCVSRKCGELHSLKEFSCPRCSGPVEFKHDLVIEDDNSQHIKPNTLRIWCEPCQESYSSAIDNLPWLCGANGCKSMLAYGLVGNETTELVFALCLEIASRVNATTNLYRAVLSADSTTKALELLVDARLLESQKNNFHIGRIINEPKHYQITRKGDKKLAEYRTNFSRAGLLDILYGFITWRINTLRKAESTRSYDLLKDAVGRMQARNLPEDVRASLLKDKLSDVRIRRELAAYAAEFMREGKTNEMPAWLRDFYGMNTIEYFTTHKKARRRLYEYNKNTELTEEIVDALLNVRGRQIALAGPLKLFRQYVDADMLRPVEEAYLKRLFSTSRDGIGLDWLGAIQYYHFIWACSASVDVYHVAEKDVQQIMEQDYSLIWIKSGLKEKWEQAGLARAGR